MSLSKFIEDFLDYQIEYAYGELSKIGDMRDPDLLHHASTSISPRDITNNIEEQKQKLLAEPEKGAKAKPMNKLGAAFLQNLQDNGTADNLAAAQKVHNKKI